MINNIGKWLKKFLRKEKGQGFICPATESIFKVNVAFCPKTLLLLKQQQRQQSLLLIPLGFSFFCACKNEYTPGKQPKTKYTNCDAHWQGQIFEEITCKTNSNDVFTKIVNHFCDKFPRFLIKKMIHSTLLNFVSKAKGSWGETAVKCEDNVRNYAFWGNAIKNLTFCLIVVNVFTVAYLLPTSSALAAKDFNVKNNSQSFLFVNGTSGNVGINTAGPLNKFSVVGGVGIGTGINSASVTTAAPSGGMLVEGNVGLGTTIAQAQLVSWGNVGLGTFTAANARLETDGFRLYSGPAAGYVLVSGSTGIGTWMAPGTIAATVSAGGSASQLQYNNGSGFAGITNSNVTASGNVGLGTTFSTNNLDISGGVGIGSSYAGYHSAPSNGLIVQGNVGIGTITTSAKQLAVGFRPTSQFAVDSGGATTISVTTSSVSALTVTGDSLADGRGITVQSSSGSLIDTLFKASCTGGSGAPCATFTSTGGQSVYVPTGNVGIGTSKANSNLAVVGNIGIGTVKDGDRFLSTAPPNGGMLVEGNVGLGTTIAQAQLVSWGNVGLGTFTAANARLETDGFRLYSGPAAGYVLVSNSTGIGTWMAPGTIVATVSAGGSASQLQYNNGSGFAGIANSNVTASGNVGLGTTLSTNKLDVSGSVGIGSTYAGYYGVNPNGLIIQGNLGIGTFAPTKALDVNGDFAASGSGDSYFLGNVGVGSSAPGTALDIQGTARTTGFQLSTNPSSGYVLVTNSAGVGTWMPAGTLSVTMTPAGNNRAVQYNNSSSLGGDESKFAFDGTNVGIGSVAPVQKLSLVGNIGIGTVKDGDRFLSTAPPNGGMIIEGNVGLGTTIAQAQLVSWGNVGLGTFTAANARLETDGFRLYTGPAAGYVLVSSSTGIGTWMAASTLNVTATPGGSSSQLQYNNGGSFGGITNSNVDASGNIGLGTTLSTNKLDVSGGVGIGSTMAGYFAAPANGLAVQGNVGIGTRSAQAALVVTNGNVGIGTWTPSAALSVGKNAFTVASDGSISALSGISGLASAGTVDFTGGQASSYRFSLFNDCNSCSGDYFGANIGVGNGAGGTSGTFKGLNVDVNNANSGPVYGIYVNTIASGGINSAGIFMGGNVGIGTFRPVTKLAIAGGVGIGTGLNSAYVSTAAPSGGMIVQGNVGLGTTIAQAQLVSWGNVGLGTFTAANARLETDGFRLYNQGAAAGYVLVSSSTTGIGTWMSAGTLPVTTTVTPAGNNRAVQYNNSSSLGGDESKFAFDGTNVGIGSVAPVQTLSIVGNIGIGTVKDGDRFLSTAPPNGGMIVEGNVGIGTSTPQSAFVVTNGNVGIGTWTAAGGSLIVQGRGNVGISTAWPGAKFEVNSNAGSLTNVARFINGQTSLSFIFDTTVPATGVWSTSTGAFYETQIGVSSNTDLWIVQNNSPQIKIDHNGGVRITNTSSFAVTPATTISSTLSVPSSNVGIGTSSLQTAFAVTNGNVGIATWSPSALFQINQPAGSPFVVTSVGNVGVGTITPQNGLVVTNGNMGIGTWTASSSLAIRGSFAAQIVSKTSAYTATATDYMILVDASGGAVTITLPASAGIAGRMYVIKKTDSSGNAVTIDGNAAETVDGSATISTATQYQAYTIICDGSNWWVI